MSHHDHHAVGETVAGLVPPGGSEDPEPISTGYFVLWGFVLLLALVFGLQYLAWNSVAVQADRSAGTTVTGPAGELRAAQEAQIPGIETSMRDVAREHGRQ